MSIFKSRVTATIAGAATVVALGATGAVAADVIGSQDVRDDSLRSVDVRDGALMGRDLDPHLERQVDNSARQGQVNGLEATVEAQQAQIEALTARVEALEADDASGVNTNWAPSDEGSTIVDANTLELRQFAADGTRVDGGDGTSVEIQNLDLPVQSGRTYEFTYELKDGAAYAAGLRVFIEIDGTYYNTNDGGPADYGVDNGDGTFTKTVDIPTNGRVGAAGVVFDNSTPGSVTVTDLVISGHEVSFK